MHSKVERSCISHSHFCIQHSHCRTPSARPSLRHPHAGPVTGLRRGGRPLAGAGHRRQQRHLQRRARAAAQAAALRQRRPPRHPLEHLAWPGHHRGLVLDCPVLRHQERRDDARPAGHRDWRQREPDRPGRPGARGHHSRLVEPAAHAWRSSESGAIVPPGRRRAGPRGDGGARARHVDAAFRRRPWRRGSGHHPQRRAVHRRGRAAGVVLAAPRSAADAGRRRRRRGAAAAAAGSGGRHGAPRRGLQPHRDAEDGHDASAGAGRDGRADPTASRRIPRVLPRQRRPHLRSGPPARVRRRRRAACAGRAGRRRGHRPARRVRERRQLAAGKGYGPAARAGRARGHRRQPLATGQADADREPVALDDGRPGRPGAGALEP